MENAIKAFYMAAGMLIGVMVLAAFVYLFKTGAQLGENYQFSQETLQLEAFNTQFDKYQKVTKQNGVSKGYSFLDKGNTASEIISCANLAYSINKQNEYDNRNHVQVVVITNSGTWYVNPLENQPKNSFVNKDIAAARSGVGLTHKDFYDFLGEYNEVRIVDIVASGHTYSSNETIYKYYFDIENVEYSDITGKIVKLVFKMKETSNFSNTTYWHDMT